jgi:hypothetical protein
MAASRDKKHRATERAIHQKDIALGTAFRLEIFHGR